MIQMEIFSNYNKCTKTQSLYDSYQSRADNNIHFFYNMLYYVLNIK